MNGATVTANSNPLWMRFVFGRKPRHTLARLIGVVIVSVVLFRFILIPIRVSGHSMFPTYRDGKVNVVNHQAYRWHKPQRGDVIAFRSPEDGNVVLLKRIVALPGERVRVVQGRAMVNGHFLDEPYAKIGKYARTSTKEFTLESDQYFVIGDNRNISIFRLIPEHYILGKVLF